MLSVPRKIRVSGGCITCRRRKKGCDKNRPICNRCSKTGLACEGYDDDGLWIHTTVSTVMAYADYNRPPPERQSDIALPISLAQSAREQLCFGAFHSALQPGGRHYSSHAVKLSFVGWIDFIPNLCSSEPCIRYISIAIGAALLALESGHGQLRIKGLQAYNMALCEMAKALAQPTWHLRHGLLAVGRLLTFYDVLVPAEDRVFMIGWTGHHNGAQAMMLARGPHAYMSGVSHALFVDSRINMILLALGQRKKCPFSVRKWKTIPWRHHKKSPKDQLLDCLQEMPGILEQLTTLMTLPPADCVHQLNELSAQCEALEAELLAWRDTVSSEMLKFDYTATKHMSVAQSDVDISILHMSIIYWISLMILYSMMNFLQESQFSSSSTTSKSTDHHDAGLASNSNVNATAASPRFKDIGLYASKCLRALHFYWESESGMFEKISGLLALSFVLRWLVKLGFREQRNEEIHLLYSMFKAKLFQSDVGSILRKLAPSDFKLHLKSPNEAISRTDWLWF